MQAQIPINKCEFLTLNDGKYDKDYFLHLFSNEIPGDKVVRNLESI